MSFFIAQVCDAYYDTRLPHETRADRLLRQHGVEEPRDAFDAADAAELAAVRHFDRRFLPPGSAVLDRSAFSCREHRGSVSPGDPSRPRCAGASRRPPGISPGSFPGKLQRARSRLYRSQILQVTICNYAFESSRRENHL